MTDFHPIYHQPRISFLYGGEPLSSFINESSAAVRQAPPANSGAESFTVRYELPDGLAVTGNIDLYPEYNAFRQVFYFENTSESDTRLISDLHDCDTAFALNNGFVRAPAGYRQEEGTCARIFRTTGSNWARDEYSSYSEFITPGQTKNYSCSGGRSAQGLAPYFEVNKGDAGCLIAIGWTGQWNASFTGDGENITVRTGIEGASFYLRPKEKIRTSSVLILEYENGRTNGHIMFRRLFKKHFSLIGTPGRPETGPLCFSAWGALSSGKMIKRLGQFKEYGMGAEIYWIDAGWYGYSSGPCPNEHTGDWGAHTGSWNVNPNYHPDGLKDVAATADEAGMGMLLWVEPERVLKDTDTPKNHPEWFLKTDDSNQTWLLNLGCEEALSGTFDMLSGLTEELNLVCYRQDFNMDPLAYWRRYDEENRRGMTEIKYINGLYRLWDRLLDRFPHIFIDNCASGGRRNDIEMLSRSMPLWRSDYQCTFNADPETAQIHTTGASAWLPYHGTGLGTVIGDTYKIRSCYAPSMTTSYWMYDENDFSDSQPLDELRARFAEYKRVRPYFSCDFYPLSGNSLCDTSWCAWQFDRPEQGDGIVMAFRRPLSPMTDAAFDLGNIDSSKSYIFSDADTGENTVVSGKMLLKDLFKVHIPNKRESKLYFYRTI